MANLTAYPLKSDDVVVRGSEDFVLQERSLPVKRARTESGDGDKDISEEDFYADPDVDIFAYSHPEIPDELYHKYRKQVYESKGFDVDDISMYDLSGAIIPYARENSPENSHVIRTVIPYAELAIKHFNEKENANFEFLRVLKANTEVVCGVFFYITFEAKDAVDGQIKTFQAKVLQKILDQGSEVQFCRLKSPPTN